MTARLVRPGVVAGRVSAPPSKSYTHRALVAGFLAGRPYRVLRPLVAEDTRVTLTGLQSLGAAVERRTGRWSIRPGADRVARRGRRIDCRESGTSLRFLVTLAARGDRPIRFAGRGRLAFRPMEPLYRALRQLRATVRPERKGRSLPCVVQGPIDGGEVELPSDISSQFVSALLLVLPTLPSGSRLHLVGRRISRPYVAATRAVLAHHGVEIGEFQRGYGIAGGQEYRGSSFAVPGDASSAAYLWGAAAATGGSVTVTGIPFDWPQADLQLLDILEEMGARVDRRKDRATVAGPVEGPVDVDLTDAPDLFPLVAVLAGLVTCGTSRLRGAPQLSLKESDRRQQTVRLVRAMGAEALPSSSNLAIRGVRRTRALRLLGLADHRLVMSAALAAMAAPRPSLIGDARAVGKSFPQFWNVLDALQREGSPA